MRTACRAFGIAAREMRDGSPASGYAALSNASLNASSSCSAAPSATRRARSSGARPAASSGSRRALRSGATTLAFSPCASGSPRRIPRRARPRPAVRACVEQRQRQQQPVLVAFVQQPRIGVARGGERLVDPIQHEQRDHLAEVEMARAGVGVERMETGDGGARVLQRLPRTTEQRSP